jgi:hypothetical protein
MSVSLKLYAVLPGHFRWNIISITLIYKGQFDRLIRHALHNQRQFADLSVALLIGKGDQQGQQVA